MAWIEDIMNSVASNKTDAVANTDRIVDCMKKYFKEQAETMQVLTYYLLLPTTTTTTTIYTTCVCVFQNILIIFSTPFYRPVVYSVFDLSHQGGSI